jgi:hypothetical protein
VLSRGWSKGEIYYLKAKRGEIACVWLETSPAFKPDTSKNLVFGLKLSSSLSHTGEGNEFICVNIIKNVDFIGWGDEIERLEASVQLPRAVNRHLTIKAVKSRILCLQFVFAELHFFSD